MEEIKEFSVNSTTNRKKLNSKNKKLFASPPSEIKNPLKTLYKTKMKQRFRKKELERKKKKEVPVPEEKLKKYSRGDKVPLVDVQAWSEKIRLAEKEEERSVAVKRLARREILLPEVAGHLEAGPGEVTSQFKQSEIAANVDPLAASKRFDLNLPEYGPYRMSYTRNGRFLLLGGRRGHIAALDWHTKRLNCEFHVREAVYDVTWLHQETMFAVAQHKWTYIYDNQGIEIHCLKQMNDIISLQFLPYHFLLASVSRSGFLSWLDVSVGNVISNFRVKGRGQTAAVAQHPGNAHLAIGETSGVVSFWNPNSKKPAISKLCHSQPISAIAFEPYGMRFGTAAADRSIRIWDARNLQGPLSTLHTGTVTRSLSFSQRNMLAMAVDTSHVMIYRDSDSSTAYLRHSTPAPVHQLLFCPWEDVLGIAHANGFSSVLVPGCGEPNFDALEANPFQSRAQRREAEVKALLDKIPVELITWDPKELQKVHQPSLQAIIDHKNNIKDLVRPPKVQVKVRKRTGKAGGTVLKRKMIKREQLRKEHYRNVAEYTEQQQMEQTNLNKSKESDGVLDRFIPKKVKKNT